MNNMEKYLPLGTIVLLKNGKKKIMITGFAATAPETKGKLYDYIACLYPEGIVNTKKSMLFNHEQIDKVYHMGYVDEEWKSLEIKIKELVKISENLPKEQVNDSQENGEKVIEKDNIKSTTSSENMFRVNTDLFN